MAPQKQPPLEWWNPFTWWDHWYKGVTDWLGGLGGDIASGIEGGQVALLTDIFKFMLPFLEILAGILVAMWAISVWLLSSQGGRSLLHAAAGGAIR